jgi:hypothetical protein
MPTIDIGTKLDLEKLIDSRLLIQGNSGAGKSYTVRKLLEESYGHVLTIVLDMEGEFHTIREKYDFLLIGGKSGDISISLKAAKLLPRKILELKVPTIVDMSDLKRNERIQYVRDFLHSLMELPKEYWIPCLVVLVEAHNFCGQQEKQDSYLEVIDLMTRGRKRRYCGILETQRISKLHKDAAAECNNKMVGRTFLDIDMKRASEELGFTRKEDMLSLRELSSGEFFCYGVAIKPHHVHKVKIEKTRTTHGRVGMDIREKISPATPKIKAMLSKLSELPQEAEKEFKEKREMIQEIQRLKVELQKKPVAVQNEDESARLRQALSLSNESVKIWQKQYSDLQKIVKKHHEDFRRIGQIADLTGKNVPVFEQPQSKLVKLFKPYDASKVRTYVVPDQPSIRLRDGAYRMLKVASVFSPLTREKMKVHSGISSSTTFSTYLNELLHLGYIDRHGKEFHVTSTGLEASAELPSIPVSTDEVVAMWKNFFREGACRMLDIVVGIYPEKIARSDLKEQSGILSSTTFSTYLHELRKNGLIKITDEGIIASKELFG